MFYLFFLLFILLSVSLFFSVFKTGNIKRFTKVFRILSVVIAVLVFCFFFIERSVNSFRQNLVAIQLINHLDQTLDFYLIKVSGEDKNNLQYDTKHVGSIRSQHFRMEYLDMNNSDQYWISGFSNKKDLVYFSQHSVPNKNLDQIIEVKNYINQSSKLSSVATEKIETSKLENIKTSVWITLDLLLLFLNTVLLLRRRK